MFGVLLRKTTRGSAAPLFDASGVLCTGSGGEGGLEHECIECLAALHLLQTLRFGLLLVLLDFVFEMHVLDVVFKSLAHISHHEWRAA